MDTSEQYYSPHIAAKALVELTQAMLGKEEAYAKALLSDPRMVSNRGFLASCGINMRKVKQVKEFFDVGLPTLEQQRRAIHFLNQLDQEYALHG